MCCYKKARMRWPKFGQYCIYKCVSFGLRNTKECLMTYRQSKMSNRAKYTNNMPLQPVLSKRNLLVVDQN